MTTIASNDLNTTQREAVQHTDGPLLIIAGAGTGKTRVITERILHLLCEKNVTPSQILALTFTEKAAAEMEERVDIGLPLSHEEIAIKTFHGFCDSVLRERGLEIGIDAGYKVLNQTEQWLFMRKNLFSFELDYYRPLGNPGKFLFLLLHYFNRLKDEDISTKNYLEYAKKLFLKKTEDQVLRETARKTMELVKAYETYQKLMMEQNCLDFGDLQYYTLRLLEERPSVLNEYRERYRYILVDELQDTNFAQNKLIMLLANAHRNITVVGDDDQAIYKWRGASLSNILNFRKNFPDAKQVVLSDNYRSTQEILDLSYKVIQNNNPYRLEMRENIEKRLIAKKTPQNHEAASIWHFSSYLEEANAIAQKISELVGTGQYIYKDFAILVRANNIAKPFSEALKSANIPFSVKSAEGLLVFEEIKDLLAVMRFLRNPYDDVAFFRLLSLPLFGLPMGFILDLVGQAKKANHEPLFKYLGIYFRKISKEEKEQQSLPGIAGESEEMILLEPIYELFNRLLNFSTPNHTISRILGEFLDKSGYYKNLTTRPQRSEGPSHQVPEGLSTKDVCENAEAIIHIAQFLEVVNNFEHERQGQSLSAFLEYLELLDQAEGKIEALPVEEADKVNILTIHSAKGLEFGVVFLPSLVQNRFPAVCRREALEIPQVLIQEELPSEQNVHLQEERRLFYVACTRAKDLLFLSYSDFYEGTKKWKPSIFLEEAKPKGATDLLKCEIASEPRSREGEAPIRLRRLEGATQAPITTKLLFIPKINIGRSSYSQLDTFQTCPLKYKFRYMFKIPSPVPHAANFGSSVHNALNAFYQRLKKGETPTLELMRECYEKTWIATGYESRAHENARKLQGWDMLENFYQKESQPQFIIPSFLEKSFRLKIGEYILNGRIDRIDQLADGKYEVVDYKTGTSKRSVNIKKDLQLSVYALACREIFHLDVGLLSFYFLEDAKKVSTTRDYAELKAVKAELLEQLQQMEKSDFSPTPGWHCSFCEYRILCHAAL